MDIFATTAIFNLVPMVFSYKNWSKLIITTAFAIAIAIAMFQNNKLIENYRFYWFLSSIEIIDLLRCINYRDQIFQARTTLYTFKF